MGKSARDWSRRIDCALGSFAEDWKPLHLRLHGAPKPIAGEIFSSWIWRCAAKFGVSIRTVLGSLSLKGSPFYFDCRWRTINSELIALTTGLNPADIDSLLFPVGSIATRLELACLTVNLTSVTPVIRYCSDCFAEDDIPYIRKTWRLASHLMCEHHYTILRDRCLVCEHRVGSTNSKMPFGRTLAHCEHCLSDFRKQPEPNRARILASERPEVIVSILGGQIARASDFGNGSTVDQIDVSNNGDKADVSDPTVVAKLLHLALSRTRDCNDAGARASEPLGSQTELSTQVNERRVDECFVSGLSGSSPEARMGFIRHYEVDPADAALEPVLETPLTQRFGPLSDTSAAVSELLNQTLYDDLEGLGAISCEADYSKGINKVLRTAAADEP
jgi:hypothetical protein